MKCRSSGASLIYRFQAEFCLLEQILPDTASHPFASTMLAHFEKLSTPIKSVATYPTLSLQCSRFRNRGWSAIQAQSLWSAWGDGLFLTPDDRRNLDQIEPFDEYEEFCLFASHYLLLQAKNYGAENTLPINNVSTIPTQRAESTFERLTGQHALRRFGGALAAADVVGNRSIVNCFGLGNNNRLSSYDVYTRDGVPGNLHVQPKGGPSSRMCFQMTDLGDRGILLTGGRSSPARSSSDCWLFKKDSLLWERTFDLPVPLYRHSACRLASSSLALVLGGRSVPAGVSDLVAVYHPERGWLQCNIVGSTRHKSVFGALLTCTGRRNGCHTTFHGYFAGGLLSDGMIDKQILAWDLSLDDTLVSSLVIQRWLLSVLLC